jgi:dihydrofolate reductase
MNENRRLILLMSVSLDGFLAHTDHTIDWLGDQADGSVSHDAERHHANLEVIGQAGQIVLGRRACVDMAPAWQNSDSPMARLINTLPKLVFSSSVSSVEWDNARITGDAIEDAIPALKGEPGDDIICFGGARFAHALARHRLIDEYRLTVHPVALGEGLPLWQGLPEPQRLRLVSSTVYADGAVTQAYTPALDRP